MFINRNTENVSYTWLPNVSYRFIFNLGVTIIGLLALIQFWMFLKREK